MVAVVVAVVVVVVVAVVVVIEVVVVLVVAVVVVVVEVVVEVVVVMVVALLQPPSWQMHFDPLPGVQSAVSGANIFVCLSVGVCAVCALCAIMRSAIHGMGARTNAHNTISAAAPEETAHVYGSGYRSGTRFRRGFCLEFLSRSLWQVFPKSSQVLLCPSLASFVRI